MLLSLGVQLANLDVHQANNQYDMLVSRELNELVFTKLARRLLVLASKMIVTKARLLLASRYYQALTDTLDVNGFLMILRLVKEEGALFVSASRRLVLTMLQRYHKIRGNNQRGKELALLFNCPSRVGYTTRFGQSCIRRVSTLDYYFRQVVIAQKRCFNGALRSQLRDVASQLICREPLGVKRREFS